MSSSNLMSLPIDIVWKRLAFDEEMMRKPPTPGFRTEMEYPPACSPSVTIFYSNPAEEAVPDDYQNEVITYLKVVCSLTGTTAIGDTDLSTWPPDHAASQLVSRNLTPYYGCYGAILQVDVLPHQTDGIPISEYPYFLDFEPKKREIFESVTASGEVMTESKEALNIRKSGTTTDSLEAAAEILTETIPQYRGAFRDEYTSVRNVDASREARETVSHTTTLSQLYQQLNSYHLGTNRALFVLQPRPHFADPKYQTFINGPRRLEGIQEFFLVVIQPKSRPGLCVSAHLRTGHFAFGKIEGQPIEAKRRAFKWPYFHSSATLPPSGDGSYQEVVDYASKMGHEWEIDTEVNKGTSLTWESAQGADPPVMLGPGWKLVIDTTKTTRKDLIETILVTPVSEGIRIFSKMKEEIIHSGDPMEPPESKRGDIWATLTVHLKSVDLVSHKPEDREEIDFFVKSKSVGGCLDDNGRVGPRPTSTWYRDWRLRHRAGPLRAGSGAADMNQFSGQLVEALRDMDEVVVGLYGPGPVSNPMHTDFVIKTLREGLGDVEQGAWLETAVDDLAEVTDGMKPRLLEAGIQTRSQLLELPLPRLQDLLGITDAESRDLYLNAWDFPGAET